jgi:hypothetical protein
MANQPMPAGIYVVFVAQREFRKRFSRLKGSGSENFTSRETAHQAVLKTLLLTS